mgnify:CR=1 FL=1
MRRSELETVGINTLRQWGRESGITSTMKADIIAALADDYREHAPVAYDTPTVAPSFGPNDGSDQVVWPLVPDAACEINGGYIDPPWFAELEAASSFGHVELLGPAGSGKTLAVHKLAAVQGRRLAVVTADGGLRKRDLIGGAGLRNGSTVFHGSEFAAAARSGAWALIDEANMAEPDAIATLLGMLDHPGSEGSTFTVNGQAVGVHPEFRCFITRNPGYAGTKRMNEAFQDRFWSIEVPPLLGESLDAMLVSHGVDQRDVRRIAVMVVEALYHNWEQNRIAYQISPRRALQAAEMYSRIGSETAGGQHGMRRTLHTGFWALLTKSITTKIDAKHDREAVARIIEQAAEGWRLIQRDENNNDSDKGGRNE